MNNMDERRSAFENKYANDLELKFRIEARAVRAFGLWVAEQMNIIGEEANVYADRLVRHNLKEPGLQDVLEKAREDLPEDRFSDHVIDVKLVECLSEAEAQAHNDAA